jgi:hypothetical protein
MRDQFEARTEALNCDSEEEERAEGIKATRGTKEKMVPEPGFPTQRTNSYRTITKTKAKQGRTEQDD